MRTLRCAVLDEGDTIVSGAGPLVVLDVAVDGRTRRLELLDAHGDVHVRRVDRDVKVTVV